MTNRQLERQFGYSTDELRGERVEQLLPQRDRSAHQRLRARYFERPKRRPLGIGRHLVGLRKDGAEFAIEIGIGPIEVETETAAVVAVTDISRHKAREAELRRANQELNEFTYIASHDLRSPLQGVASLAEWLAEDMPDYGNPEIVTNLERITLRVNRMERLIEDLLDYARASTESGECRDVFIPELIDEVIALSEIPERFEIKTYTGVTRIKTQSVPLASVLRNLIGNAVKHHDREEGRIEINVIPDGRFCLFTIKDDGYGIPAYAHQRIFKMFQSLDSGAYGPSGMGLAISRRLVESHGGRIEVSSDEGLRGATFRFWWPRFDGHEWR